MKKIDLKTPEYSQKFEKAPIYAKKGAIDAVEITQEGLESGEYADKGVRFDDEKGRYVIDTFVMRTNADGKRQNVLESTRIVEPGEWIATNPKVHPTDVANNYVIPDETFRKRYESTAEPGVYRAKGMARIIKNDTGDSVEIMAPWGEPQYGDANCYFRAPFDVNNPDNLAEGDRYILSANDFFSTYGPADEILGPGWAERIMPNN